MLIYLGIWETLRCAALPFGKGCLVYFWFLFFWVALHFNCFPQRQLLTNLIKWREKWKRCLWSSGSTSRKIIGDLSRRWRNGKKSSPVRSHRWSPPQTPHHRISPHLKVSKEGALPGLVRFLLHSPANPIYLGMWRCLVLQWVSFIFNFSLMERVGGRAHAIAYELKSGDNLWEPVLSFYHLGHRAQIQIIRLDNKYLYPLPFLAQQWVSFKVVTTQYGRIIVPLEGAFWWADIMQERLIPQVIGEIMAGLKVRVCENSSA